MVSKVNFLFIIGCLFLISLSNIYSENINLFDLIKKKQISKDTLAQLDTNQINIRNPSGDTLLTYTIKIKNYRFANVLLQSDINIYLKNYLGQTALILSAKQNNTQLVKKLLKMNVDLFERDFAYKSAFDYIIINTNTSLFRSIVKNDTSLISSYNVHKIFLWAVKKNKRNILRFLIRNRIKLDKSNPITDKIILHSYLKKNYYIISWLRKHKIYKNNFIKKQILLNQLIYSIKTGNYRKLKYFLKQKIKINRKEKIAINNAVVYFFNKRYNYYSAKLLYNTLKEYAFKKQQSWLKWASFLKKKRLIRYIITKNSNKKNKIKKMCEFDLYKNNAYNWAKVRRNNSYILYYLNKICIKKQATQITPILIETIKNDRLDILKEFILNNKIKYNFIKYDNQKHSLLYIAFKNNANLIINYLINKKINIVFKEKNHPQNEKEIEDLVYLAVLYKRIKFLKLLVSQKIKYNKRLAYKGLKLAICMNQIKYYQYIEKNIISFSEIKEKNEILLCSAKAHSIQSLLTFLPKTKSLIKKDISGLNILDYISLYGYKNIIQKMFSIDSMLQKTKYLTKALFYAAENNQSHIIRLLIKQGAVVNERNLKK